MKLKISFPGPLACGLLMAGAIAASGHGTPIRVHRTNSETRARPAAMDGPRIDRCAC